MGGTRLSIVYDFRAGPYGGANQFLKALRDALRRGGAYGEDPREADAVLFNSHHDLDRVAAAKKANPEAVFVHRVDGPMRLYNEPADRRDAVVMDANHRLADATVFQSVWSREANRDLGFAPAGPVAIIGNAPDPAIFNRERAHPPLSGPRVRLIAASWSVNPNKGFDVYEHLDARLDFGRFEMTFVGNSPIRFRNIRHVPPCGSAEVARHLKDNDLFVAASLSDPCSNSLIEALACGIPAVARRDGGHPEIVGEAGLLFDEAAEVPDLVERIVARYRDYANGIAAPDIDEIARRYLGFVGELLARSANGSPSRKRIRLLRRFVARRM
jgi:glycosyltransferase involved in cell wall biosynthesis